jgi:hypothetical protein
MSRWLVCFAILLTPSLAAHATRARFKSPWHLIVTCDNDKLLDDVTRISSTTVP